MALAPVVATTQVVEQDDVELRRYTGKMMSPSVVQLTARVSGELLRLGFQEGSLVEKGQMLFELDSLRYDATVKNAEAKLAESRARAHYAQSTHQRNQTLLAENVITEDRSENLASEHEAAAAAVRAAEANVITARDDLTNTKIVAPQAGKIGLAKFTPGNYVTPTSGVLATVVQMDPLRVSFSISNRDFLSQFGTEEGLRTRADIRLRLADDTFYEHTATVEFIDNQANRNTDTVQVYARVDNPDRKLLPDGTVTVVLARRNGKTLPAVPPSAVVIDADGPFVYVVDDDGQAEMRRVVLGPSRPTSQLLREGVRAGEWVVSEGTDRKSVV